MIRETNERENDAILALYPAAFPEEDLQPLVRRLLSGAADVLSLGMYEGDDLVGHVMFTTFSGAHPGDRNAAALLGPLCVHPDQHASGIGTTLVGEGFLKLTEKGIRQVFVLGDPNYYGRFGFEVEWAVLPPYPLPDEWEGAWQSRVLGEAAPLSPGTCSMPEEWMDENLWR